ncbi:MAG: hypothetical protein JKX79_11425 [Labilibaculum sp.]|nr:hypothetical protein [Labilibaculum sp.]
MDDTLLSLLPGMLFIIPGIIILIACINYLEKNKSSHAIMLLVGASLNLLVTVFHSLVVPILMNILNVDFYSGTINVFTIITPISFIGSILFALGLLFLIQEKIKLQRSV